MLPTDPQPNPVCPECGDEFEMKWHTPDWYIEDGAQYDDPIFTRALFECNGCDLDGIYVTCWFGPEFARCHTTDQLWNFVKCQFQQELDSFGLPDQIAEFGVSG